MAAGASGRKSQAMKVTRRPAVAAMGLRSAMAHGPRPCSAVLCRGRRARHRGVLPEGNGAAPPHGRVPVAGAHLPALRDDLVAAGAEQLGVEGDEVADLGGLPGEERAPAGASQDQQRQQPEDELLGPDLAEDQEGRHHQERELGEPGPARGEQAQHRHPEAGERGQGVRHVVQHRDVVAEPLERALITDRPGVPLGVQVAADVPQRSPVDRPFRVQFEEAAPVGVDGVVWGGRGRRSHATLEIGPGKYAAGAGGHS